MCLIPSRRYSKTGGLLTHALNDYTDDRSGTDERSPAMVLAIGLGIFCRFGFPRERIRLETALLLCHN